MPDARHRFVPLAGAKDSPNARCGVCLGFSDDRAHGGPGPSATVSVHPTSAPCPDCEAAPGSPCLDKKTNRVMVGLHRGRYRAARESKAKAAHETRR